MNTNTNRFKLDESLEENNLDDSFDEYFDPNVQSIIDDLEVIFKPEDPDSGYFFSISLAIDSFISSSQIEIEFKQDESDYPFYLDALKIKNQHPSLIKDVSQKINNLFNTLDFDYPFYSKILAEIKINCLNDIELKLNSNNDSLKKIFSIQDDAESRKIISLLTKNGRPTFYALDAFLFELRKIELKHIKKKPFINFYKPIFQTMAIHSPDLIDINDFSSWDKIRSRLNYLEKRTTYNFFMDPQV